MVQFKILCVFAAIATLGASSSGVDVPGGGATMSNLVQEVEDNSRYKTLEANATLMKLLVNNKDGVTRTEVFDMLHSRDDDDSDMPVFPEDVIDSNSGGLAMPDSQAEFLQATNNLAEKEPQLSQPDTSGPESVGLAAGLMIFITGTIVCLAYTSLIVWRRIYLKRNGLKHELLRNEDIAETRIEL